MTNVLIWSLCVYLLLIPLATLTLNVGRTTGNTITQDRLHFQAVNALTLTGFQAITSVDTYPPVPKLTIFILTAAGAIFAMALGGMAVARIIRLPYSDKQVVLGAVLVFFAFTILGALPLLANGPDAFMLSASAFGNSGLFFGKAPGALSWQTWLVLMPLSILGGLGLPVLMEIFDLIRGRGSLSRHARTVLCMTAALYLAGFGLLLLSRWLTAIDYSQIAPARNFLGSTSVAAINSRALGMAFDSSSVTDLPRGMPWVMMLLMMIGASSASTGGGLKTTTIVELGRGIGRTIRGEAPGRPFGIATVWLVSYLLLCVIIFLLLVWLVPEQARESNRLMFDTVSAVSNVGLSFDDRTHLVMPGSDIMAVGMLLGALARC